MWLVALFDLPVHTKAARKRYSQFRKILLREGLSMMQFSVYARHCSSEEAAQVHAARIAHEVPEAGQVRLLLVTDRQFAKMKVYSGRKRCSAEAAPAQLLLF
jgi:CRISPR-associated protein Cas2